MALPFTHAHILPSYEQHAWPGSYIKVSAFFPIPCTLLHLMIKPACHNAFRDNDACSHVYPSAAGFWGNHHQSAFCQIDIHVVISFNWAYSALARYFYAAILAYCFSNTTLLLEWTEVSHVYIWRKSTVFVVTFISPTAWCFGWLSV